MQAVAFRPVKSGRNLAEHRSRVLCSKVAALFAEHVSAVRMNLPEQLHLLRFCPCIRRAISGMKCDYRAGRAAVKYNQICPQEREYRSIVMNVQLNKSTGGIPSALKVVAVILIGIVTGILSCSYSHAADTNGNDTEALKINTDSPASSITVNTANKLYNALDQDKTKLSTDPDHPTEIIISKSVSLTADTPMNVPTGTYVVIRGSASGIEINADEDWSTTRGSVTADSVPALVTISGNAVIENLTIDTSNADDGVRCVGVTSTGSLYLENTVITGSQLKYVGGMGIYTLGDVVMGEGAAVENITVNTNLTINYGVGVCVGYYYNRATKEAAQGSLVMNSGSGVRNNRSGNSSGVNGIGIYNQGILIINRGASVTGNTARRSDTGVGIYMQGESAKYPAITEIHGGTISDNKENGTTSSQYGTEGGGISVSNYSTLIMDSGTVSGNLARRGGGGIAVNGTTNCNVVLSGGEIKNNISYGNGAGIYISGAKAEVTLKDSVKVTGNTNQFDEKEGAELANTTYYKTNNGGGIYNAGILNIEGGTISGNKAISSVNANSSVNGQGGGVFNDGTLTMSGGSITDNEAGCATAGDNLAGGGGGLTIRGGDDPGIAYITGGTIEDNKAKGLGDDVLLNAYDATYNNMNSTMQYTPAPGKLYLGDKKLKNSSLIIGKLTIPEDTYAYIRGTLVGSDISIEAIDNTPGTVVCEGNDYDILISDARALKDQNGKKTFTISNGKIVTGTSESQGTIDIAAAAVSSIEDAVYTGEAICPDVSVTLNGKTLVSGQDYQIVYYSNTGAGTAEIKIYGMGDYYGTVSRDITFKILPRDISKCTIDNIIERVYTGSEVEPSVAVKDNGVYLTEGEDFEVQYQDNIDKGTASVKIAGLNNYTGDLTGTFEIVGSDSVAANEEELKTLIIKASDESTSAKNPEIIYITGSVDISESITIPSGTYVEFVGENSKKSGISAALGFEDTAAAQDENSLFTVKGSLTLADLTIDAGSDLTINESEAVQARTAYVAGNGSMTVGSGAVLTSGSDIEGRAIYNEGTLLIKGGSISENDKTTKSSIVKGTVYNSGTLSMTGGKIADNLGVKGGGLYNARGGKAYLSGGYIKDNKVAGSVKNLPYGAYGGGIYNESGADLSLEAGLQITGNTSTQYGAGVASIGSLTINGAVISENTGVDAGAGVFSSGDTLMKDGSRIEDNIINTGAAEFLESTVASEFAEVDVQSELNLVDAAACGGGVYVQSGTFTMDGGSISNNSVVTRYNTTSGYYAEMGNGGGVYVANDGTANNGDGTTFIMNGGTISGNSAKASYITGNMMGHGGGVYVLGGENADKNLKPGLFRMTGGLICGNNASETGDEVFINDAYRLYKERTTEKIEYPGTGIVEVGAEASIIDNDDSNDDGVYIPDGINVNVISALTGKIRVTAEAAQEAVIAVPGDDYAQLTDKDALAFENSTDVRTAVLEDNTILLKSQKTIGDIWTLNMESKAAWTGTNIIPEVTITNRDSGKEISSGNYQLTFYRENSLGKLVETSKVIDVGTYTVKVSGTGKYREYSGSLTANFVIEPADISNATVGKIPDQAYTGNAINYIPASNAIKFNRTTLLRGSDADYTLTYENNTEIGTATMILTGHNNFTGTKTVTFRIVPKQAGLNKLSSKSKKLTVKWRKDAGVTGYQIVIAKDKAFTKGKKTKTVTKYNKKGVTFTKLTKKKVYYVKIRTYKTVAGENYYGAYSTVKKLKVK